MNGPSVPTPPSRHVPTPSGPARPGAPIRRLTMARLVLVVLVLAFAGFLFSQFALQKPLRGLAQTPGGKERLLLSRARPALTFALRENLPLLASGWCSIQPESRVSLPGNARLQLAVHGHDRGVIVCAVADAEGRWEWDGGHHAPFPTLRDSQRDLGAHTLFETVYVLDAGRDPFCTNTGPACLVHRTKLLLEFRKCQILLEYHEDIPANLLASIAHENDYLNAFQERARTAATIVRLERNEAEIMARNMVRLNTLERAISRRELARWTGRMHRRGEL